MKLIVIGTMGGIILSAINSILALFDIYLAIPPDMWQRGSENWQLSIPALVSAHLVASAIILLFCLGMLSTIHSESNREQEE